MLTPKAREYLEFKREQYQDRQYQERQELELLSDEKKISSMEDVEKSIINRIRNW